MINYSTPTQKENYSKGRKAREKERKEGKKEYEESLQKVIKVHIGVCYKNTVILCEILSAVKEKVSEWTGDGKSHYSRNKRKLALEQKFLSPW